MVFGVLDLGGNDGLGCVRGFSILYTFEKRREFSIPW